MTFTTHCLLVFAAAFCLDGVWILYMKAARLHKPVECAFWSGLMFIFGGFNVISYTENHWYLGFAAAGAMVGTFLFMKFGKKE